MFRRFLHAFAPQKIGEIGEPEPDPEIKEKLTISELRYRRLFETAQDGILILDGVSGNIIDVNPFLQKLLGYSAKDFLGKQLWEIGVFKDIKDSKASFVRLQKKGYIRYKDLPLQTNDGRKIAVEFVSNVYMVGTQKVIQCNIRDITDRKEAENTLQSQTKDLERTAKSQEEIKKAMLNVMEDLAQAKSLIEVEKVKDDAMLASIGDGMIAVDTHRKVLMFNRAAEMMLGWKAQDMIGQEVTSLPLEDEEGRIMPLDKRPTTRALVSGKSISATYYFVRKDKTRFPIAINVTPIKLGKKIIGAVDIFRDITQEKEIDRAKSEFVSLASHQLRTPLGISKWYLEAIMSEEYFRTFPQKAKEYLNEVYKNNERLLVLVRDLLSISRIDQGKVRNTPQLVDIIEIIQRVIKSMSILAGKNNISVHFDLKTPTIPVFYLDPLRVQEVIENLVSNAITYSNPSGIVEIIVEQRARRVHIAIKDTGVGITNADQKRLFTKFFRSQYAVAKNTEGSGLGLYVVKSYVHGWGGTIEVESTKGKGSTFTITIPIKTTQKNRK